MFRRLLRFSEFFWRQRQWWNIWPKRSANASSTPDNTICEWWSGFDMKEKGNVNVHSIYRANETWGISILWSSGRKNGEVSEAKLTVLFRFPNHEGYYVVGSHNYLLVCKNLVEKGHLRRVTLVFSLVQLLFDWNPRDKHDLTREASNLRGPQNQIVKIYEA